MEVILLSNVRLSFPHIAEPQKRIDPKTGKERSSYSADFIMPPDHPGYAQFMKRVSELALLRWKEHASQVMQMITAERKQRCYGDGNQKVKSKTFQPYDGYAGQVFITAHNDIAPQIIQADGSPIDLQNTMAYQALTRKMYGGCRVNAAIKPWLQDNQHGRGVRCDLVAIQFAGDDQPFGEGAVDVSGMFGQVQQAAPTAAPAPAFMMPVPPFMAQ